MSSKVANRCKAIAKSTGEPCKAFPTTSGLCYFHANPDKVSELGRKGGLSKQRTSIEFVDDWYSELDNPQGVHDTIDFVVASAFEGTVSLERATKMVALLKTQLRTRARRRRDIVQGAMDVAFQGEYEGS